MLIFSYLCPHMTQREHTVIVSLASNEGAERNLRAARELLGTLLGGAHYTSELWTEPVGTRSKAPYLNQLCRAVTPMNAAALSDTLKEMERRLGRTRGGDGTVAIDLDLLQYDGQRMHLRDWERDYVKRLICEL